MENLAEVKGVGVVQIPEFEDLFFYDLEYGNVIHPNKRALHFGDVHNLIPVLVVSCAVAFTQEEFIPTNGDCARRGPRMPEDTEIGTVHKIKFGDPVIVPGCTLVAKDRSLMPKELAHEVGVFTCPNWWTFVTATGGVVYVRFNHLTAL